MGPRLRKTLLLAAFPLVSACREPVPTAPPKTPVKPMAPDGDKLAPDGDKIAPVDTPKPGTPDGKP